MTRAAGDHEDNDVYLPLHNQTERLHNCSTPRPPPDDSEAPYHAVDYPYPYNIGYNTSTALNEARSGDLHYPLCAGYTEVSCSACRAVLRASAKFISMAEAPGIAQMFQQAWRRPDVSSSCAHDASRGVRSFPNTPHPVSLSRSFCTLDCRLLTTARTGSARARLRELSTEILNLVTITLWELDTVAPERTHAYPLCKLAEGDPANTPNEMSIDSEPPVPPTRRTAFF